MRQLLSTLFLLTICSAFGKIGVATPMQPLTSVDQIVDGESYMLRNTGRNRWLLEDGYAALTFAASRPDAGDRTNDFVFKLHRDDNGCYVFETRRGRYIPEVDETTPQTVGNIDNAGHFRIEPATAGTFTIVNTTDTRYGFDGTAKNFVGWNAAQGANCKYEILPVEFSESAYPLGDYKEPEDEGAIDVEAWLNQGEDISFTWGSRDIQYSRHELPAVRMTKDTIMSAWRGERLGLQAIAFSRKKATDLTVELGAWKDAGGNVVAGDSAGTASWVRYVITDDNLSCGDHEARPTHTVPDVIDPAGTVAEIEDYGVRPVWCTLEVPRNLDAGTYTTSLVLSRLGTPIDTLSLSIRVVDQTLPEVSDQKFHLDFWQQPYSVSRYYGLERWSDEHFEAMRPYMQALGRAGQKVVTAILFHEPWGRQSYDKFDPMVETTLKADGTWTFDYAIFDRWVEFMDECGINAQINCYSMVPWDMTFRYLDEAADRYQYLNTQTGSDEYKTLWTAFLTDFASHLKEKGWFEKTAIGMDERGLNAMRDAIAIVSEAAPGLKISLAGNYHAEITADLHDYSVAYSGSFPAAELARRKEAGQISTSYVCCADPGVNIFTNKPLSDAAYIPIQAIAAGLDGILHWSWLNWPENPLLDSRLQLPDNAKYTFAPGDTYCFYPGPRSSVRFERLIEGIQQTEKVRILRDQWSAEGNQDKLAKLTAALKPFISGKTSATQTSAIMVTNLESLLNGVEERVDDLDSIIGVETSSRSTWHGNTLHTAADSTVTVYSLSGMLLHRMSDVTNYCMDSFTPGNYIVTVSYPDGFKESFNLRI